MSNSPLSLVIENTTWERSPLSENCVFIKDGTHGTHIRLQNGVPLLSAKNITSSGKVSWDLDDSLISEDDYAKIHAKYELKKNDLLLTVVGTLGRRALVQSGQKFTIQRSVGAIRLKEHVLSPDFLFQFVSTDYFQHQLELRSNATAQAGVYLGELAKIKVPVPPLPEQQKIAAILTAVDEVIASTQAQISKLKDLKIAMMQELLTKGIGHTEFKDSAVGRIPAEWSVWSAQQLLDNGSLLKLQDGNHGSQYPRTAEFVKDGVPYVAASDISEFGVVDLENCSRLTQERANQLRIKPAKSGDVILTHNATIGRTAIVPDGYDEVIASTSTTYYRVNPKKILNTYLFYYFQSTSYVAQLQATMGQTTRNQVPITAQRQLDIILPPLEEQGRLSEILQSIAENIRVKTERYNLLLNNKKALMQDLLTGKVRVRVN